MTTQTYSATEVQKLLGISRGLTYKLIREGKLPVLRIGVKRLRLPKVAIDDLVTNGGVV